MGDDPNYYNSLSGSFWNPSFTPDIRGALISMDCDENSKFHGTWSLSRAAQDNAMALPGNGNWKLTGWCGDDGDHNTLYIYDGSSSTTVLTLNSVDSGFTGSWSCGQSFTGSGTFANGTAASYQLGVPCV
jgi:hypothetical protein